MKLQLYDYPGQEEIKFGKIKTFDIEMNTFPDKRMRTIRVWLPESYDGSRKFPVLYLHDAQNLFAGFDERYKWYVEREMEALSRQGIECIVVGIDTAPTRFEELCPPYPLNPDFLSFLPPERRKMISMANPSGDKYAEFIAFTLKPLIDESFMTIPDAANTGIGGASMGGLESFYMALRFPDIFGRALVFSPAFTAHSMDFVLERLNGYDFSGLKDSRIFMYNGGQTMDETLTDAAFAVFDLMIKSMSYKQIALITDSRQPHFESAWQRYFGEAVYYLFAEDNSVVMPPVIK